MCVLVLFVVFTEVVQAKGGIGWSSSQAPEQGEELDEERPDHEHSEDDDDRAVLDNVEGDVTQLTGRKKKLFELRLKMVNLINLSTTNVLLCSRLYILIGELFHFIGFFRIVSIYYTWK
jgi:hypothetical protein